MNRQILHRPIPSIVFRMFAVLVLYSLLRIVFYAFNSRFFPQATAMSFVYGIRFDVTAVLYTNIVVLLLSIIPAKVVGRKIYGIIVASLFVLCNTVAFAFNLVDVGYFPFSHVRSSFGLFGFIAEVPNIGDLAGLFVFQYWYLLLILVLLIVLLVLVAKWTFVREVPDYYASGGKIICNIGIRILIICLVVVGIRGGFQLKPIGNNTAAAYDGGENTALILNTPFSIIRSIGQNEFEPKHYFETDDDAFVFFSPLKGISENNMMQVPETDNVVVIILEGISSEYSSFLSVPPKALAGYTPFIDSLAQKSVVFRGYANGMQSIVALSSVLGSIPSLSETPFSKSPYIMNKIDYPTRFLSEKGFKTAFFHGANNGTMGFDDLCKAMGVSEYYGLDEYPNKSDYDGAWGIPDYQYLQYVADVLDSYNGKFVATVFTLTSHHPFVVPEEFDSILPQGDFPMQHTVAYTDMALQKFFDRVSRSEWYDRTLFVITADHTNFAGSSNIDYDRQYDIPMIFYHPKADTVFFSNEIMQQTDIMPSVVSYLGLNGHYTAFGNNVFDTLQTRFAVSRGADYYKFTMDGKDIRLYDSDEIKVVASDGEDAELSDFERNFVKAFVYCYTNGMINNSLHSE